MIQVLKQLILPPAPLLLIILVALIAAKPVRWLKWASLAALAALAILCTPLVSGFLLSRLEPYPPIDPADPSVRSAQAIVILSAEQRPEGEYGRIGPGPLSLERLRYGAYLAKRTGLPILISGGDPGRDGAPLADSLGSSLTADFGIRPRWLERRSMDTTGNARESAKILKRDGVGRVLLVTHAWHMPRARLAFEREGLQVTPAPTAAVGNPLRRVHGPWDLVLGLTPQASGLQQGYYFLHETIGIVGLELTSIVPTGRSH